jgi:plastocyanin
MTASAPPLPPHDDMKKLLLASIAVSALVLWAVSCGGGGGGGTPTAPSNVNPTPAPTPTPTATPTPTPAAQPSVTVNIVGTTGSGAFSPNPIQAASGASIVWRNTTAVAHVLVMNNGTAIGTLAPGASLTTNVSGNGGGFRCINHPSMVGSINGTEAPKPPDADPDDPYDY